MDTKQFIDQSNKVHNNCYDYCESEFVNLHSKLIVVCKKHGKFEQVASDHLKGRTCKLCSYEKKKMSTSDFIEKAKHIHKNKYSYSLVKYASCHEKVVITCPVHGDFLQKPTSHIRGSGCCKCGNNSLSTEDFIKKSNITHKNKYTYTKSAYVKSNSKVIITCPDHGDFLQRPEDHMYGYGCISCSGTKPITKTEFIERSNRIHGNVYDYSNLEINGIEHKGEIVCKKHGAFTQRLGKHMRGLGCPKCSKLSSGKYSEGYFYSHSEMKDIPAMFYFIVIDGKYCKVGITRQSQIRNRFPRVHLTILVQEKMSLYAAFCIEQSILELFEKERYKCKESVTIKEGWTECFPISMTQEIKQEILGISRNYK